MMSSDRVSHCHLSLGNLCPIVLVCINLPSVPSQCQNIPLNPVSHYLYVTLSHCTHCPSAVSLCLNVRVSHCISCQFDISQSPLLASPTCAYSAASLASPLCWAGLCTGWPICAPSLRPVCMCVAASSRPVSMSAARAASPHWCWAAGGGHGRAGSSRLTQRQGAPLAREGATQGGGSPASLHHLQVAGQGGQGAGQELGMDGCQEMREAGGRRQEAGGPSAAMRESMGWHGGWTGPQPSHQIYYTLQYTRGKYYTLY